MGFSLWPVFCDKAKTVQPFSKLKEKGCEMAKRVSLTLAKADLKQQPL